MEILDNETQQLAVECVLEEMQKAEEIVNSWNASWLERFLNAYCLPLHYEVSETTVRDIEKSYDNKYNLANAFYSRDSIGVPLAKVTLFGNVYGMCEPFEVEFGKIDWYGMNSHKATRHFSFNNNGVIEFSKSVKPDKRQTPQHPKTISYNTSFNVLADGFDISIIIDQLTDGWDEKNKYNYLTFSLKGNILTEKLDDIEIVRDLSTGRRLVRVAKKYDKKNGENNASVIFEAELNADDSLKNGAIMIETHKRNGKVNGTYRFDISLKKGVRANFYSRKGTRINLMSNPVLLGTANTLLSPIKQGHNSGDIIVSTFSDSAQTAIAKSLCERVISFDNSDFNMESVNQAEKKIIEMVKCIKGELPLPGLISRIDDCLEKVHKNQNVCAGGNAVLKLESSKKQ